eukprot:TRINITY_DN1387_c0_g3_i1.p1 TRINITY_DN1387_c0_g3~~TRINITY_DN1387_c0_g3_i1.p1  ORF type:complete len:275 (-),score=130.32 TRINITY_DN1387_c0_g3_i1:1367-2191(-)
MAAVEPSGDNSSSSSVISPGASKPFRGNPPGTRAADFNRWSPLELEDMDSTLAVQQYIQQTIREDVANVERILTSPENQDEGVWKYEQLRQFSMELNGLAVLLQGECHPKNCTQMTATEQWIFLCAAHKTPNECPAIDYTRHTLDGAACLLNSNKYFPSRVSIKECSIPKLSSVCRRVYRIFSHAYFHHRTLFDAFEAESHLCRRFTLYVTKYGLMSREILIIPMLEGNSSPSSSSSSSNSANESTQNNPSSSTLKGGTSSPLTSNSSASESEA